MLPHHSCSGISNKKLTINGTNNYQIVIPANASKIEEEASLQLKKHLLLLSKQAPNVVKENEYNGKNGIFIGQTNHAKNNNVAADALEEDGYVFKNIGDDFLIQGGSEKGLIFGIYSLLESFGFRKYAADDPLDIPSTINFELPNDIIKIPKINYRTTNYYKEEIQSMQIGINFHQEILGVYLFTLSKFLFRQKNMVKAIRSIIH